MKAHFEVQFFRNDPISIVIQTLWTTNLAPKDGWLQCSLLESDDTLHMATRMRFIPSLFLSDVELGEKDQEGEKGDTDVGALNIYLLVADMYAAGLVTAPTFDDLDAVLCALNACGLKGLQVLGYLFGSSKPASFNASSAFKAFYEDVESQLTPDENLFDTSIVCRLRTNP